MYISRHFRCTCQQTYATVIGTVMLAVAFGLFTICTTAWMLYLIAFLLGVGLGYINPASTLNGYMPSLP